MNLSRATTLNYGIQAKVMVSFITFEILNYPVDKDGQKT